MQEAVGDGARSPPLLSHLLLLQQLLHLLPEGRLIILLLTPVCLITFITLTAGSIVLLT